MTHEITTEFYNFWFNRIKRQAFATYGLVLALNVEQWHEEQFHTFKTTKIQFIFKNTI